MSNKVIFLDFDGVLNSMKTHERQDVGLIPGGRPHGMRWIDPINIPPPGA